MNISVLCVFERFEILLSAVFFAAFLWHFFHHNFLSDHFRLRFHRFYCCACVSLLLLFHILFYLLRLYIHVFIFIFSLSLCLSLIPIRWLLFNKCASASAYSLYSGAIINDSLALNASMAIAVCVLWCAGWAQSARARMYTLGEHSYVSSNRTREVTQMAISQLFKWK